MLTEELVGGTSVGTIDVCFREDIGALDAFERAELLDFFIGTRLHGNRGGEIRIGGME